MTVIEQELRSFLQISEEISCTAMPVVHVNLMSAVQPFSSYDS